MAAPHPLIGFKFDSKDYTLSLEISLVLIAIIVLAVLIGFAYLRIYRKSTYRVVEMDVTIGAKPEAKFKVRRDTTNLYIAHRIYLELVTRKAAIPFEEDKDAIVEVYNSWYKLFGVIRDEIKALPGDYLVGHGHADDLVRLTLLILNDGLRPHLTTYQADFRRFYVEAEKLEANKGLSPQAIQRRYPQYNALVADMRQVNQVLKDYAEQLAKLIKE